MHLAATRQTAARHEKTNGHSASRPRGCNAVSVLCPARTAGRCPSIAEQRASPEHA
nr:hypothetical protein RVX_2860 [Nitratidesulfovibrio sp. HK-II]